MSAQGIRAGRAYVELGTNDSKLTAGLRAAQAKLQSWGKSLAIAGGAMVGAGAAVLGPMIGATAVFATSGDELSKMADKTGASVESLSELRHAASQSAVDFKQLGSAMNKQQRNLAEAASGNKAAGESFENLGLSVDELLKLSPDQQFEVIADKISKIEDPAKRTAAAMDVFGRSGAELLPMMIGGAKGIQALRKEARDLGLQVSASDAAAATKFGDTWANVQTTLKQVAFNVGAALAPALTSLMEAVLPIIASVSNWISRNRQLVLTVASIAAGVMAAGAALVGIGGVFTAASLAIGGLITAATTLAPVIAAIVSPVGLLVAGVVALTAGFLAWTDAGKQVMAWFGSKFSGLTTTVSDTFGGIFNAIKGGRLELAAEIAFTGLKLTIATIMESIGGLFGQSIKSMAEKLGWLMKEFAKAKAQFGIGLDRVGSFHSNMKERSRLNQKFTNLRDQQIREGRFNTPEARRELDLISKQIDDLHKPDTGHQNAVTQIYEDLNAELSAIDAMTADWIDSFDPNALRQKLADLNREAAKAAEDKNAQAPESNPAALPAGFSGGPFGASLALALGPLQEAIRLGIGQKAQEKFETAGSFSSEQAARFGSGRETIPKQQLEELKGINKHVKRTAEKRGGVATP